MSDVFLAKKTSEISQTLITSAVTKALLDALIETNGFKNTAEPVFVFVAHFMQPCIIYAEKFPLAPHDDGEENFPIT
jgi:hypothetical protein